MAGLSSSFEVGWPTLEDHGQRHFAISISKFLKIGSGGRGSDQGEEDGDGRRAGLSSSSEVGWLALEDHGQRHLVVSMSKFLKTSGDRRVSDQGEEGKVEVLIRGRVAGSRRSWPETSCHIRVEILEDQWRQKRERPRGGGQGWKEGGVDLKGVDWGFHWGFRPHRKLVYHERALGPWFIRKEEGT